MMISAIHRLSGRIVALEDAVNLIRWTRLVAEEELAFLRARVAPPLQCVQMRLLLRYCLLRTPRHLRRLRILPKFYLAYLRFAP
ncbi:hypothetical protein BS47DRAFT_1338586, partial [Hydnum rufescens UP504]